MSSLMRTDDGVDYELLIEKKREKKQSRKWTQCSYSSKGADNQQKKADTYLDGY